MIYINKELNAFKKHSNNKITTIKLPYNTDKDLTTLLKQYLSVVKYNYNRFLESKTEKEIRELTKSLNNINVLNSWLLRCVIKDGKAIQTRFKGQKVIFRGKSNYLSILINLIHNIFILKSYFPKNIYTI